MDEHLVFFDPECPFCHKAVEYIISIDPERRFVFASLYGQIARDVLSGPQKPLLHANSIVLVENFRSTEREFWIRSQAILRIYWLLGGKRKVIGSLCFVPSWLGDLIYRYVAAHRHQFKLKISKAPGSKDRFLD
jgi:predicted DCC family thiol-disulfide oxidoreductase YuxK